MLTRNNGMHPRHSAMGIENRSAANDFDGIRPNIGSIATKVHDAT